MSNRPTVNVSAVGFLGILLAGLIVFSCVGVKVTVQHETVVHRKTELVEAPR